MRPNFFYTVCFTASLLVSVVSISSNAQVVELTNYDSLTTTTTEELSTSITDEPIAKVVVTAQKDSVAHQHIQKPKEEPEEEDSILSFNFLYYIIQKFKFSDIINP